MRISDWSSDVCSSDLPGNSTDQNSDGARMAGYQYSYVMKGLTKTFPGAPKPVLNNIHLQFLPGTKIAIIGVNGAGKSTMMKLMAGFDQDYRGEAWAADGVRGGSLAQEQQLDQKKRVRAQDMDGG